jgi:hypothetical protein
VSDVVLVDYTDRVMTIMINRPQVRNAIDYATTAVRIPLGEHPGAQAPTSGVSVGRTLL